MDRNGSAPLPDDAGFRIVNDRGLTFDVQQMVVTTFSAALVPCEPSPPKDARGASILPQLFGMPRAFAGHNEKADPSEVHAALIEDFVSDASSSRFGTKGFPAARYCRVHYLIASTGGEGSLRIAAKVRKADGKVSDLTLRTPFANALLKDLAEVTSGRGDAARVTITRSLEGLFDGVQLEGQTDKEVSRLVLKNLISHTRVSVALGKAVVGP